MAKKINPNMFTPANAEVFWKRVKPGKPTDCWPWPGPFGSWQEKAGYPNGRKFGLFRRRGCGYVMNQRFAYIDHCEVPVSERDRVRVRPTESCKERELCCNPAHIERTDKRGDLCRGAAAAADREFEGIQKSLDSYGDLDQERIVFVRREQSFLRQYLFRDGPVGICSLCGEEFPVSLLVAAHIKRRAECSDSERRDYANNTIPMCSLGCDALFERGLLIVKNGRVQVRLRGKPNNHRLEGLLEQIEGRMTPAWKVGRIKYFTWHSRHTQPGE